MLFEQCLRGKRKKLRSGSLFPELIRFQRREERVSVLHVKLISIADVWVVYVRFANYSQCPFCQTSLRLDLQHKHPRLNIQY